MVTRDSIIIEIIRLPLGSRGLAIGDEAIAAASLLESGQHTNIPLVIPPDLIQAPDRWLHQSECHSISYKGKSLPGLQRIFSSPQQRSELHLVSNTRTPFRRMDDRSQQKFATTHWTVVLAAGDPSSPLGTAA